jgi:hypothetical protein
MVTDPALPITHPLSELVAEPPRQPTILRRERTQVAARRKTEGALQMVAPRETCNTPSELPAWGIVVDAPVLASTIAGEQTEILQSWCS